MMAGSLDYAVDAAIATQEPAFMAKYAFQLAQAFNNFYHKHHILSETDEQKREFLLIRFRQNMVRSEEHTSELQSHLNLVCRLLLETKMKRIPPPSYAPVV